MFFVNGRPCGLPQVAKAFNEIYKSYSVAQSPFIMADLRMDTSVCSLMTDTFFPTYADRCRLIRRQCLSGQANNLLARPVSIT